MNVGANCRTSFAEIGRWGAFIVAFVGLAELARALAFEIRDTGLIIFWPPAGLLLAVLVRTNLRDWWKPVLGVLIGSLVYDRGFHGASFGTTLVYWFGNCLAAMAGALFLKACKSCDFSMESVPDVLYLLVGGLIIQPAISSIVTTLPVHVQAGSVQSPVVLRTFLGTGLGVLLIGPLVLAWSRPENSGASRNGRLSRWRILEALVGGLMALALTEFVFSGPGAIVFGLSRYPFWLFAAVIWAGLRFPPRYAYMLVWGAMFLAIANTAAGRGPFASPEQPVEYRIVLTQGFVAVMSIITISLAASMTQRRSMEQQLSESREVLQSFFDEASDLITWVCPDGRLLSANRAWREKVGFEEAEVSSVRLQDLVDAQSWTAHQKAWTEIDAGAENAVIEMILQGRRGDRILVETSITAYRIGGKTDHFREISRDITHRREHEQERERLIQELQTALTEVKTLRGFIPICSGCKKIRTEAGAWQELEEYLGPRMEGHFTHGLCAECGREQFGEYWDEVEKKSDT